MSLSRAQNIFMPANINSIVILWNSIPFAFCNTFPFNTTNIYSPFPGSLFFPFPNENSKGNSSSSLHNNAQFIYTHLEIDGNSISQIQLLFASNMVVGGAKRCLARVSFSTNVRVIYQDFVDRFLNF